MPLPPVVTELTTKTGDFTPVTPSAIKTLHCRIHNDIGHPATGLSKAFWDVQAKKPLKNSRYLYAFASKSGSAAKIGCCS
jgi:hypothetical protein